MSKTIQSFLQNPFFHSILSKKNLQFPRVTHHLQLGKSWVSSASLASFFTLFFSSFSLFWFLIFLHSLELFWYSPIILTCKPVPCLTRCLIPLMTRRLMGSSALHTAKLAEISNLNGVPGLMGYRD